MKDRTNHVREITKNFKEVQKLITKHNSLKNKMRSIDRQLKSSEINYSFLHDITSINGKDILIEVAAKKLFKSAGFTDVRHLKNVTPKREDLQIWCDDCIIIVECKGTKYSIPQDNEVSQVLKYINFRKNKIKSLLPVFGLTIINHDNSKPINMRNPNPIDRNKNEYSLAGKYGIITTVELTHGFSMLKTEEITFEQFKNSLIQFGDIKFGVRVEKT